MKLFIPLAEGFEDIEALTVVDILRRAGISIDTVGVPGSVITSKSGVRVMVDKRIVEIKAEDYDGIVLPGGGMGVETLGRTNYLLDIIKNLDARGKLIAAICAAPSILAKNGILEGKKASIYPGMEKELPKPRDERVVVDGSIITSQGPGTTIEFALKLVSILKGQAKANQIKTALIV